MSMCTVGCTIGTRIFPIFITGMVTITAERKVS